MRRLAPVAVSLLALALVAAASARDPRAEKLKLNARDNRAARASVLTAADLQSGWQKIKSSGDDSVPSCPGYRPDFSKFTITGRGEAEFRDTSGELVISSSEVYASHAQAIADYGLGTKPQVASCLAQTFEKQPTGDPSIHIKAVSAKEISAPRIGERSARYKIVLRFTGPNGSVPAYLDAIVFQKGRTIALLMTLGVPHPITDGPSLAGLMSARASV